MKKATNTIETRQGYAKEISAKINTLSALATRFETVSVDTAHRGEQLEMRAYLKGGNGAKNRFSVYSLRDGRFSVTYGKNVLADNVPTFGKYTPTSAVERRCVLDNVYQVCELLAHVINGDIVRYTAQDVTLEGIAV